MKLKQKIVSILLALAIFNFNLVLLPVQAMEGCHCDHPHGDGEFACFCGVSHKPSCDSKGPSLSKGQCGMEKHSDGFCIPAHEHPTLFSTEVGGLTPSVSILFVADSTAIPGVDLLPMERPPSIF